MLFPAEDNGSGCYDGASADYSAVKDGGMHADEYMVFNGAGMHYSAVADGYIVTDNAWMVICYMEAAEILYIGTFTNGNIVYISSGNNAWPDAGILAYSDIAGKEGVGCYESIGINLWNLPIEFHGG